MMPFRPTSDLPIADVCIDEILHDLNTSRRGVHALDRWSTRSGVKPDRIIEGPDVTYVRLSGRAETGGPVVLTYFEGVWERATTTRPTWHRGWSLARVTL